MKKGLICLTIVCLLVLTLVLSFGLMRGTKNVYGLKNNPIGWHWGGYYGGYYGGDYGKTGQGLYDLSDSLKCPILP